MGPAWMWQVYQYYREKRRVTFSSRVPSIFPKSKGSEPQFVLNKTTQNPVFHCIEMKIIFFQKAYIVVAICITKHKMQIPVTAKWRNKSFLLSTHTYTPRPQEHQFWQSPTNESAFVQVQECNREIPTHYWRRKIKTWDWTHWTG